MTDAPGVVWLVVIAISLAVTAIIQVVLLVVTIRLIRQITNTVEEIGRDIRPLVDKANQIAEDAGRTVSLVALQVERIDHVFATTAARVDEATTVLRAAMGGPIRQGAAVLLAIRAIAAAFRRRPSPGGGGPRRDDDDALFVG